MVGRALSENVKKLKARRAKNAKLQEAVDEYHREQARPQGVARKSLRKIAEKYEVAKATLSAVANGKRRPMSAYIASKQKVSVPEERILVDYIKQSADIGFPPDNRDIERFADAIIQKRDGDGFEPVGKNWVHSFLDRHHDELQTHWSRPLDTQRARALNPAAVEAWFNLVEEFVVKLGVLPENVYGMDESGFVPSQQGQKRVVGRRGTKTQHKQGNASRENVTALVTICADGTTLDPMIIFKGKHFMQKWGENNVAHATLAHSENGWTEGELGRLWMERVFDEQTKEKAGDRPRVLLLDGHSSHYTLELLQYARTHNIIILGYPPHCTHALQGLDVVCFARMKNLWKEEINSFEQSHGRGINKQDFAGVFGRAYLKAFTPETVHAAFRATGVFPFNRTVITPEQMRPSEATSTKASFPLEPQSPVRAIMRAFDKHPPTAFDVDDNTHHPVMPMASTSGTRLSTSSPPATPSPKSLPSSPSCPRRQSLTALHQSTGLPAPREILSPSSANARNNASIPSRPSVRRTFSRALSASPDTPSKRVRLMTSELAMSSSGAYLVSKARLTSRQPIIDPVVAHPPSPSDIGSLLPDHHSTRNLPTSAADLREENRRLTEELQRAKEHIHHRDEIIATSRAQLVLQNLHLKKQNEALHEKEEKKDEPSRGTRLLADGMPRVLTADEFVEKVQTAKEKAEEKLRRKATRKHLKAERKAAIVANEARWQTMKAKHEERLLKWNAECQRLAERKVLKKDWPKKPVRPKKPKIDPIVSTEVVDEEEDDEDEGDTSDSSAL